MLLFEHRRRKPSLEHPSHLYIQEEGREESDDSVNSVMRLNVDRGPAEQHIKRNHAKKQLLKPFVSKEKVEQYHHPYHRIIEEIAHVECFADQQMQKSMTEPDSGLTIKKELFGSGKDMIEVWKETIELKSIRIPIRKQTKLNANTH